LLTFAADRGRGGGGDDFSKFEFFNYFKAQPFMYRLMHMKFVVETVGRGVYGSTDKQETYK
jgi:hypothetical protein